METSGTMIMHLTTDQKRRRNVNDETSDVAAFRLVGQVEMPRAHTCIPGLTIQH